MDETREVTPKEVSMIADVMGVGLAAPVQRQNLSEDHSVKTRKQIIQGLKSGKIPGTAVLEWSDDQGKLRANVIDYLLYKKLKAIDPENNDTVVIENKDLQDGSWRLLY